MNSNNDEQKSSTLKLLKKQIGDNKKLMVNLTKGSTTALNNKQTAQKEKQITIMLLTLSLTFIILTLPYSIFELLRKLDLLKYILTDRYQKKGLNKNIFIT